MSLAENLSPNLRERIGANNPPIGVILSDRYADLLGAIQPILDRAASLPKRVDDEVTMGRLGQVVKDANDLAKKIEAARMEETRPHLTAQRELKGFFDTEKTPLEEVADRLTQLATDYQNAKAAEERRKLAEQARLAREEEARQKKIADDAAAKGRHGAALKHDDRAMEASDRAERIESAARASTADLTRVRTGSGLVATARQSWKFEITDFAAVPLEALRPYVDRKALEVAIGKYVGIHKGDGALAGVRIYQDSKASFR